MNIPKFLLYGENNPAIESNIQPQLVLRTWSDLSNEEKAIAFQQLKNSGWISSYSKEILQTIAYLNDAFLRQCPGRNLHSIQPEFHNNFGNESDRREAATMDFQHIFLQEKSDALVFRMLSKFAQSYINEFDYNRTAGTQDESERRKLINSAFDKFDRLVNCLNHIFEQFAVNQIVTRNGFIPRQDEKITEKVYAPTLQILSDPKWKPINADLAEVFEDYQEKNYAETITKAHRAVQRFLQILVGEEGKNGKGEIGKLFQKAKENNVIPINRFTEPLVGVIQGFIISERATNSTAKPSTKDATASDALLMMNVVMVFLQYCLQNSKGQS